MRWHRQWPPTPLQHCSKPAGVLCSAVGKFSVQIKDLLLVIKRLLCLTVGLIAGSSVILSGLSWHDNGGDNKILGILSVTKLRCMKILTGWLQFDVGKQDVLKKKKLRNSKAEPRHVKQRNNTRGAEWRPFTCNTNWQLRATETRKIETWSG